MRTLFTLWSSTLQSIYIFLRLLRLVLPRLTRLPPVQYKTLYLGRKNNVFLRPHYTFLSVKNNF